VTRRPVEAAAERVAASSSVRARAPLALVALLAVAAALRFVALDFGAGVPDPRPDEPGVIATLGALDSGSVLPPLVMYGGGYFAPLHLAARVWAAATAGPALGVRVREQLGRVKHFVRGWSALLSTATVALVWVAAGRLGGPGAAVLAAAAMGAAPLAVREAHAAKADTATAFAAAVVVAALTGTAGGAVRRAVAFGGAAALAAATKYAIGVLPAVGVALIDRRPRGGWRAPLASVATFGVVWLALDPFWVTHPAVSWASARALAEIISAPAWLPGVHDLPPPLLYHATVSLRFGFGAGAALLTAPAIAWGLVTGGSARLVAIAVLGLWAQVAWSPMRLARFFLPVLPGLAVLEGACIAAVARRVPERAPRLAVLATAAALLVVPPAMESVVLVRLLARADTRELATAWIDAHLPPEAVVVSWGAPGVWYDFGRPAMGGRRVVIATAPADWAAAGVTHVLWHHYPLPYSAAPLPAGVALRSLAVFDPLAPGADPVLEPLDAFYLPLARFRGVERPGPRIELFAYEPQPPG
jgi:hypothetical protein